MTFVCAILSSCFVSCSNDDEPPYWDYILTDENGSQMGETWVNADVTEIKCEITSNLAWTIGDTNGIRVTPSHGSKGTTLITLSFGENTSTSTKERYFYIRNQETSNYDRNDQIIIYQRGVPYILPDPSKIVLDKVGGKTSIIVKSNIDEIFEVEVPSWISATFDRRWSEDGENYDYYYTLKYQSNPDDVRASHVWFKSVDKDMSNSVYVIQNGAKGTPYE